MHVGDIFKMTEGLKKSWNWVHLETPWPPGQTAGKLAMKLRDMANPLKVYIAQRQIAEPNSFLANDSAHLCLKVPENEDGVQLYNSFLLGPCDSENLFMLVELGGKQFFFKSN